MMSSKPRVHVKFFAILRDMIGVKEEWTEIEPGMTVEQLWLRYVERAPDRRVVSIRSAYSVNRKLATGETVLQGGEEIGFLPPVSGGAGPRRAMKGAKGSPRRKGQAAKARHSPPINRLEARFFITSRKLDLPALIKKVEHPGAGAIVTFTGVVRDNAHEKQVRRLEYEAYAELAAATLEQIGREATERWPAIRIAMGHRTGRLGIGSASVMIAVSSPHRAEAFAACRYAIERIKAVLPVWKKEFTLDGDYWVEGPVPGEMPPEQAAEIAEAGE